ncbi:arylformamidase [Lecanora helva]
MYGKTLEPESEISVHSGGTEAILSVIAAFIEPGDEVIVMEPAFDLYELHTRFIGGVLRNVALHPPAHAGESESKADEWTLNMTELEKAFNSRTRILVLNNPHNPLGKVFKTEELIAIGELCVKHGVIILSDEVYERLHYTETFPRIAALRSDIGRQTVTIGSIGKSFNATGWRLGYAIGDAKLIRHVQNAHIILSYTTAGPVQLAAAKGIEIADQEDFWEQNKREMKRKIDSLCDTFRMLGLSFVEPSGAHYVFVNAGRIKMPSDYPFPASIEKKTRDWKICWFLIQEFGVATIPASVLEVGTFTGFSALAWYEGTRATEAEIVTLDIRGEVLAFTRKMFEEMGVDDRIKIKEGLASES